MRGSPPKGEAERKGRLFGSSPKKHVTFDIVIVSHDVVIDLTNPLWNSNSLFFSLVLIEPFLNPLASQVDSFLRT